VVVGAGGFLGGAIVRALRGAGMEVAGLGRPSVDLLNPETVHVLAASLRADDAVVFVAAQAPVKNLPMLRANLVMLETMCDALSRRPVAHVVYVSSDAVYQDSPQPLTEDSCAQPASLHGAMHLTREVAIRGAHAGPLALIRPTLVYGVDDPHNGYGPNRFRRLAAAGEEIVLFGEGEERRDHVDVDDVAALIRLVVQHRSDGIANAVSGEVASFRELAEFVAAQYRPVVSVRGTPRTAPMPHGGYRPFDNQAVLDAFPGFRFKGWRQGLTEVIAAAETSRRDGRA
jgi:nucleoside-diphosphate-sugar epimerase